MNDWTAGYVADVGYTYGYYLELNPLRIKLAFLNAGIQFPKVGHACELGFGQGISANIHASASVTSWVGTDFNPSQAAFAQEVAAASGADTKLYDQAFDEFANRDDLPDFDYIGLHGIWSWISDDNKHIIVDFIKRKLKVGGVLYISYNTQPGWAAFAPIRHLMTEHAEILGSEGRGIINRIDGAIDFADKLLATNPMFSKANPLVAERISKLKQQNKYYLAHEYFNRDWHPMHFATMYHWLEPAKLQYACSANYADHVEILNLTSEQQSFLNEIPDRMFQQSVRDFMVNQQFRKDYWVKGLRKLNSLEQSEQLRQQKVILISHRADIVLKINGNLGEAELTAAIYNPILDALADYKIKSLGQIEQIVAAHNISFAQLLQAILVITAMGHISAAQDENVSAKAKKLTDKLNADLMMRARSSSEISYLASPVTGGGITIGRFPQLFLLALSQGKKQPEEWAKFVWQILTVQGQKIVKNGQTLESAEDNLSELIEQAQTFALKQLPIIKALQIV
jgi:SAM-dependent methyltransferase